MASPDRISSRDTVFVSQRSWRVLGDDVWMCVLRSVHSVPSVPRFHSVLQQRERPFAMAPLRASFHGKAEQDGEGSFHGLAWAIHGSAAVDMMMRVSRGKENFVMCSLHPSENADMLLDFCAEKVR